MIIDPNNEKHLIAAEGKLLARIKDLKDNSFFENAITDPIYFESALSIIDDILKKQKMKKSLKKDIGVVKNM